VSRDWRRRSAWNVFPQARPPTFPRPSGSFSASPGRTGLETFHFRLFRLPGWRMSSCHVFDEPDDRRYGVMPEVAHWRDGRFVGHGGDRPLARASVMPARHIGRTVSPDARLPAVAPLSLVTHEGVSRIFAIFRLGLPGWKGQPFFRCRRRLVAVTPIPARSPKPRPLSSGGKSRPLAGIAGRRLPGSVSG